MSRASPAGRAAQAIFHAVWAAGCLAAACGRPAGGKGNGAAREGTAFPEARGLIEQGRLDEALRSLQEHSDDPESLYLQGRVWATKAETAPLPTPPPAPSPGAEPLPAPEFKPEELQAISLLERAAAARPDSAPTQLALAQLLAPHALRRQDREKAAAAAAGRKRRGQRAAPVPAATPETSGVDFSVERVVRAYEFALRADPVSAELPEAMIAFCIQAGRLDAAEAAHQELLKRVREKPEPFVRYGDFLLNHKHDPEAAVEQYRQALIWRPDHDATRAKLADIYLARGIQHFSRQEFALAEAQFQEAGRWITDRSSPQGQRLEQYTTRLREIRLR